MRELSLTLNQIAHPQILPDGSSVWLDAGIREKLQNGCPELGWEGDPRLEVYLGRDERLHVWRLEHDGEYRLVTRSKPGMPLDDRLIRFLVDHDTHRGYDVKADSDTHNAKLDANKEARADDKSMAAAEVLAHGMRKDIGYHHGGLSKLIF